MADFIPTLASIAALIFLAFAIYTRSRLSQSTALLADAASRLEAVNRQAKQFEQQARQAQEVADKFRQQATQLDKQLEDSRHKLSDRTIEWNKLKTEREDLVERGNRQNEHLKEQVLVLTEQLAESIRDKKSALAEIGKVQSEGDEKTRQQLEIVRQQFRETNQLLQQNQREKQQLEQQLTKIRDESGRVKPEDFMRVKQKLARLEQLYLSMRGLRELAEERNKNWETALRYFAGHVLQKPLDAELQTQGIGQLVGEALEKIGSSLIIESRAEAAASEAAAMTAADSGQALGHGFRIEPVAPKGEATLQAQS